MKFYELWHLKVWEDTDVTNFNHNRIQARNDKEAKRRAAVAARLDTPEYRKAHRLLKIKDNAVIAYWMLTEEFIWMGTDLGFTGELDDEDRRMYTRLRNRTLKIEARAKAQERLV